MNFDSYALDQSIYDEMFLPDGAPREHCRRLYDTLTQLSRDDLASIQERVTRSFSNEGITFAVYGDEEAEERIIPVDCVPRVMPSSEWRQIEAGLTQRVKALNCFLEDVYGAAQIIQDGVIPADMVRGCPQFRTEMQGFSAPQGTWVAICGTDLVRTEDGFLVLEVEHYGRALLATLTELAPSGRPEPAIALLAPGVYNSAFYEHMFLARELGAELVEGQDLLVKDGVVYMRTTKGLRRVDVIYRRVDDDFIDPLAFRPPARSWLRAGGRGWLTLTSAETSHW